MGRGGISKGVLDLRNWPLEKWRNLVLVGIGLFLLFVAGATTIALRTVHLHSLEQKETQAQGLVHLLEQYTLRSTQAVDLVLQVIIDSTPEELSDHDPTFENWLRRLLNDLPDVRALFIVGTDGFITQDTNHPRTPRMNVADRSYFVFHKEGALMGLHITPPILSRSVNGWFVAASRGLFDSYGDFRGVVVAAIEPEFYRRFYRELRLLPGDAIALWHLEGVLIARAPEDFGLVGRKVPASTLFSDHLPMRTAGSFAISDPDYATGPQVIAYRTVSDMPLVVTAYLSLVSTMENLWRTIYASAASFILLCALGVAVPIHLFRHIGEREEIQQRTARLQKSEALARMTGGIAHDFNNVLASIDSGVGLITRYTNDANKVAACGKAMAEAVERGARLTAQLLSFAKGQELDVQKADLNEMLTRLLPVLRQAAGDSVRLHLQLDENLPPCLVNQTQFDAALVNLVINARDAMPEGGVIIIATAQCTQRKSMRGAVRPGTYGQVRVSDSGRGMPAEVVSRVFEPFFTTKGDKGTGLGLPQVYGFMQLIGGDARITSEPGVGTAVELYFPCNDTN